MLFLRCGALMRLIRFTISTSRFDYHEDEEANQAYAFTFVYF